VGRLAFVDDRGPIVLPVNFAVDNHTLLVRSAAGTKLGVLGRGDRVAFEVDGIDAASGTGWSVLVRGEAIEVTDAVELARLRTLPLRPWVPGAKEHFLRILPAVITGRRISAASPVAEIGD
jgi:nitroimidazol reductase NimA-like FMN-containing flavoprotein (pyridoxamine 5'-phosphate oxidase superfamily)